MMCDNIKIEEDLNRAAQRAYLYSIPAYKSSSTVTTGNSTMLSNSRNEQTSQQHPKLPLKLRLRASGPKRLKLKGPRPLPRINCRFSLPGKESKMYVHGGKRYQCPKGVEPWRSEQKWVLDPNRGVFKRFASRVPLEDSTYYYIPEEAMMDSSEPVDFA